MQGERQTERQIGREAVMQEGRLAGRHTDRQTNR